MKRMTLAAGIAIATAAPVPALACFDAAQCARDAQMMARSAERQASMLAADLRSLRADRSALSADLAAMREILARQARRLDALERENAELRDHLGLPPRGEGAGGTRKSDR